jgi:hypothetical protein
MAGTLRELKPGELTLKDMSTLRETASARDQHKKTSGVLKEYSLNHTLRMTWGLEDSRKGLRPFFLYIGNNKFTLSWGELKDLDRSGFFRRETDFKHYNLRYLDGHKLTFDTDLNDEAQRDMIFRITGKGIEAYVDWYEVLKLGRFI